MFHALYDGNSVGTLTLGSITNVEDLAGTDGALTTLFDIDTPAVVGALNEALQFLYIGRSLGGTVSLAFSNSSGNDMYFRWYEFTNVNTGTTIASVIENTTAGNMVVGAGSSATIADVDVTTTAADRLALNFIAVDDDDQASFDTEAFTGQSGGTWVSGGSYGSSTGTDGSIGLQYAAMASAGTIGGGTLTIPTDNWGVIGFALIGTTVTAAVPRYPGVDSGFGLL